MNNKGLKREIHPAIVRGVACSGFGFIGGFILMSQVAPKASALVLGLFLVGGMLLGGLFGAYLGMTQGRS
jgi:hypothetical protein